MPETREERLSGLLERLIVLLEQFRNREQSSELRCVECDAIDVGERGWTLRRDVDDELVAFCPDCDEREFRRA